MVVKSFRKLILVTLLLLVAIGCDQGTRLDHSKSNGSAHDVSQEIIDIYRNERDPEKRHIAYYIAETLPYQHTLKYSFVNDITGDSIELEHPLSLDSLEEIRRKRGVNLIIDTTWSKNELSKSKLLDIVEEGYRLRSKYTWIKNIPISTFCDLILPYRVNNEKPNEYTAFFAKRYIPYINDVLMENLDTISVLSHYISAFFNYPAYPNRKFVDFSSRLDFEKIQDGSNTYEDIEDVAVAETYALRSVGVPCAYEFTPVLDERKGGAVIVNIYDIKKHKFGLNNHKDLYKFRIPKFYRNVFDRRKVTNPFETLTKMGIDKNDIPFALNIPSAIDITDEKTLTCQVTLKIPSKFANKKVLYIAAKSNEGWTIVSWGKVNPSNRSVSFPKIGRGIKYRLVDYTRGKNLFITSPFTTDFHEENSNDVQIIVSQ